MADKNIERSQDDTQGIAVGQSNEDQTMPVGAKGSHEPKNRTNDIHIPNQDRSSASNQDKSEGNSESNK